jgi:hypothetical protein
MNMHPGQAIPMDQSRKIGASLRAIGCPISLPATMYPNSGQFQPPNPNAFCSGGTNEQHGHS